MRFRPIIETGEGSEKASGSRPNRVLSVPRDVAIVSTVVV